MADRHTLEELITIVLMMQEQLDTLNENIERLIEQLSFRKTHRNAGFHRWSAVLL